MADSYVKDAFLMPQNLAGLGLGAVVLLALPFHGLVLLGLAAAETLYLKVMSGDPRFQRAVRSRRGQ